MAAPIHLRGGLALLIRGLVPVLVVAAVASSLPVALTALPVQASEAGVERIQVRESRRIAVLDFDFDGVSLTGIALNLYGGGNSAMRGVSNMLTNQLVRDGSYILIERSRIDSVLSEQNLGQSGRIEATTAAQIGRILGVDAVVLGSVNQFHVEKSGRGLRVFGFGSRKNRQQALVQMSARMVSTATGEILVVAEGKGEADQVNESVSIGVFGEDRESSSEDRLLGEAANLAVNEIVTQLVEAAPKLAALPAINPTEVMTIADIAGSQVILNRGGQHGFRPGMVVSVERVIREVTDPETGRVLRAQTEPVGQLQLTEVDPQSSVARVLSGQGFRVGDRAKAIDN